VETHVPDHHEPGTAESHEQARVCVVFHQPSPRVLCRRRRVLRLQPWWRAMSGGASCTRDLMSGRSMKHAAGGEKSASRAKIRVRLDYSK
jgi:hypothetical protein